MATLEELEVGDICRATSDYSVMQQFAQLDQLVKVIGKKGPHVLIVILSPRNEQQASWVKGYTEHPRNVEKL